MHAHDVVVQCHFLVGLPQPALVVRTDFLDVPFQGGARLFAVRDWLLESRYDGVVVAHDARDFARPDDIDDFVGVGVIAHDVAETHDIVGAESVESMQNRAQCLEIRMYIRDNA